MRTPKILAPALHVLVVMCGCAAWAAGCGVRPPMLGGDEVPMVAGRAGIACQVAETQSEPPNPAGPRTIRLGTSVEGTPLVLHLFGRGDGGTLVIGGIHGDEPNGADVAQRLLEHLEAEPGARDGPPVAILPQANPDGLARGTRGNARGVDVNRNFPAANWRRLEPGHRYYGGRWPASEPETCAVLIAIRLTRPERIIAIHAISGGRHCNNFDGPAEDLARAMSALNGYPVVASLGPCHGSLGNWAGVDGGIPILTLELPRLLPGPDAWDQNRDALLEAIGLGRFIPVAR